MESEQCAYARSPIREDASGMIQEHPGSSIYHSVSGRAFELRHTGIACASLQQHCPTSLQRLYQIGRSDSSMMRHRARHWIHWSVKIEKIEKIEKRNIR